MTFPGRIIKVVYDEETVTKTTIFLYSHDVSITLPIEDYQVGDFVAVTVYPATRILT